MEAQVMVGSMEHVYGGIPVFQAGAGAVALVGVVPYFI